MKTSPQSITYWKSHFEQMLDRHAGDHAAALNYSNKKLMTQVHDNIMEQLPLAPGSMILDAGCGLGDLEATMLSRYPTVGFTMIAVDISKKLILAAEETITNNTIGTSNSCEFAIMDIAALGIGKDSMDIAIAAESLQYSDIYVGITELIRVVKKNGIILASVPNSHDPIIKNAESRNKGHYRGVDIAALMKFVKENTKVTALHIKSLIFAKNQSRLPYQDSVFTVDLSAIEIESANRFIVKITV